MCVCIYMFIHIYNSIHMFIHIKIINTFNSIQRCVIVYDIRIGLRAHIIIHTITSIYTKNSRCLHLRTYICIIIYIYKGGGRC